MEQLKNLKVGQKYTLVKMGDMGFCYKVQFELIEVRVEPYAQYPESILLVLKERRKRNRGGIRFLPRDSFLIFEGFVDANTEMFVSTLPSENGITCRVSLANCDVEYLYRAKRSVSQAPVIEHITDADIASSQKRSERKV